MKRIIILICIMLFVSGCYKQSERVLIVAPKENDAIHSRYGAKKDLSTMEELNNRAKELIDCNIEAISIFYQDSLPFDSEQSEGPTYPVKSEKFLTFEDLMSFVYNTYQKKYADKMLFTWKDGKPMYLDVNGKLYVDSSKVGSSGYYVIWDNYKFILSNINKNQIDLKIYLKKIEVGTDNVIDITMEGKLINQNDVWVLDRTIW